MCYLRHKLKMLLFSGKVMFGSQDIQVFVFLTISWFTKSSKSWRLLVHDIGCIGWIKNFTGGGDFFTGWREPKEAWFWRLKPFSKLKTAFRECWTSIKIKINMACVSKEYEIKTKMEQEQWLRLKILFLLDYNLKIVV